MPRPGARNNAWPTPRTGTLDITCSAPSSIPGAFFTLTLTGEWEELPSPQPHHSPEATATDHALTIARNITSALPITDAVPAAARINTLLGRPTEIHHIPVRLVWAKVHLSAESNTVQAAIDHQRHLHEHELRRTEQTRRLDEARVLRDSLLSDPSLGLAYWFATAPETIDKDTLARLEELLLTASTYAPQGLWAPLARLLMEFAARLHDEDKAHLIDTLAALTDRYGQADIATAISALRPIPSSEPPARDEHRQGG